MRDCADGEFEHAIASVDTGTPPGAALPAWRTGSLAVRLLRSVFGAYFVVTLVATTIQIGVEFHQAEARLSVNIAALERTFGAGIADAVWGLNDDVLFGILSGAVALPQVVGVKIVDEHGAQLDALGLIRDADGSLVRADRHGGSAPVAGHTGFFDAISATTFDLVHTDAHGVAKSIGRWTVYSNRQAVVDQVEDQVTVLLATAVLKTLSLWFIFLVVIERVVGRPLRQLSAHVGQLTIDNLGAAPLSLRGRGRHELHMLAAMLNRMTGEIRRSVEERAKLLRDLEEMNETLQSRVEERTRELRLLATTDALTGLANRRRMDEVLHQEHLRVTRFGGCLSVILCDIDSFKAINDTHGHHAGDLVLIAFGDLLSAHVRRVDTVGRWGGEEFLVICPQTKADEAALLAERLRRAVADARFPVVGSKTCSFGVVQMADNELAEAVVARADAALYRAKQQGRDRVVVSEAVV
jgi:diguanylate cyclase (GGDEF)-like protein